MSPKNTIIALLKSGAQGFSHPAPRPNTLLACPSMYWWKRADHRLVFLTRTTSVIITTTITTNILSTTINYLLLVISVPRAALNLDRALYRFDKVCPREGSLYRRGLFLP